MPRITDLPAATTLVGNEALPIVQGGQARAATAAQIMALIAGLTETRSSFTTAVNGTTWVLNGGAAVTRVTKIFVNGILYNNSDFTITLGTGTVQRASLANTNSTIDIFWIA